MWLKEYPPMSAVQLAVLAWALLIWQHCNQSKTEIKRGNLWLNYVLWPVDLDVGQRLKQGSIIGRVARELMFQVTQRNAHIDPLQVIH